MQTRHAGRVSDALSLGVRLVGLTDFCLEALQRASEGRLEEVCAHLEQVRLPQAAPQGRTHSAMRYMRIAQCGIYA